MHELTFTKGEENFTAAFLDQTTQLSWTLQEPTNPDIIIKANKTTINGASSKEQDSRYQGARLAGATYSILHQMQSRSFSKGRITCQDEYTSIFAKHQDSDPALVKAGTTVHHKIHPGFFSRTAQVHTPKSRAAVLSCHNWMVRHWKSQNHRITVPLQQGVLFTNVA